MLAKHLSDLPIVRIRLPFMKGAIGLPVRVPVQCGTLYVVALPANCGA